MNKMDRKFSERLRDLRLKNGLTQAALEVRAELPTMVISHYENGTRKPGLENIKSLCRGLGCTATELIGI